MSDKPARTEVGSTENQFIASCLLPLTFRLQPFASPYLVSRAVTVIVV